MHRLARPGHNCWRIERADRLALVVDAAPYFASLAEAIGKAERQIFVLGWDLDSRLRLTRVADQPGASPSRLRPLLDRLVRQKPSLEIYLLVWDYALLYALEREWLPLYQLGWRTHRRVHFEFDDEHPQGGCHHQKVVVIDDDVAFSGGIDLTTRRWDTPEHLPDDPRRVDVRGEPYGPFHDVQIGLQGPAARALGELCRQRWYRATGRRIEPPQRDAACGPCWPQSLEPDLTGVDVAIARTEAEFGGRERVCEVERLYCDTIAAARRYIYIENQYLTSSSIRDALARRLQAEQGPEVVIIGPRGGDGLLERGALDVMRARTFEALRRADRHARLGLYYPSRAARSGARVPVYVHAKVMVADDTWLRIGSANLTNRSMGLDSECDVLFEAEADGDAVGVVRRFRDRLLGEHLGLDPEVVARSLGQEPMNALIQRVGAESGAQLERLSIEPVEWLDRAIPDEPPFDPPGPMDTEEMFDRIVPQEVQRSASRPILRGALLLALLLGIAAAWRWTPLSTWADPRTLSSWIEPLRHSAWAPLVVLVGYVVGALVLFPVTVLVLETAAVFGPIEGFVYSLAGVLLSGGLTFAIGSHLGRRTVRRVAGSKLDRVSRRLARGGVLGVILVRVLPVAPYTVVNMVAGASHLRLRHFMLGTALGMLPGLIAFSLLGDRLMAALRRPSTATVAMLVALAVVIAAAGLVVSRWLARRRRRRA